jgi:FKBP-type peptidyl-prolyl cis-trans isomerase
MSKSFLIGIVVMILIVGSIVGFFVFQTVSRTEQRSSVSSGEMKIEDLQVGNGSEVKTGDTISINYRGTLINGTEFDSSYKRNQPFETQIGVGKVIKGWDQGVIGMKVGGKRRLTIPPSLGYGEQGFPPAIPPNSVLVFEVELVGIR